MKFRKGFVTNSSSSSFICEICGADESGYDIGLSDCDMVECENGHIFCNSHLLTLNRKTKIQYVKRNSKKSITIPFDKVKDEELDELLKKDCKINIFDEDSFDVDNYPSIYCPICNLDYIPDYLKIQYLLKEFLKTDESLKKEIQSKFADETELNEYLKK